MTHKNVIIELAGRRYPALRACLTAEEADEWFGPAPFGCRWAPFGALLPLGESGQIASVGVLGGTAQASLFYDAKAALSRWDQHNGVAPTVSVSDRFHGPEADLPAILAEWSRLPEVAS